MNDEVIKLIKLNLLQVLNISANYIVNLHSNALRGMANLLVLDLSNNEIVLKEEDITFLSHTPKLKQVNGNLRKWL